MVVGKVKDFYISFKHGDLIFLLYVVSFKMNLSLHFFVELWWLMVVSFDMRADYDVTFEDYVTRGWWGFGVVFWVSVKVSWYKYM